jgi:hypothetical protein
VSDIQERTARRRPEGCGPAPPLMRKSLFEARSRKRNDRLEGVPRVFARANGCGYFYGNRIARREQRDESRGAGGDAGRGDISEFIEFAGSVRREEWDNGRLLGGRRDGVG